MLMENYSGCSRNNLPFGKEADNYWNQYIDNLISEVKYYNYDVEMHTKYID